MRSLLDSSWMKFGPAGRGSLEGAPGGPTPLPSTDRQPGDWNSLNSGDAVASEVVMFGAIGTSSVVLLLALSLVGFLIWRRRQANSDKLDITNVITLDIEDSETNSEFLSSFRRCTNQRLPSSCSDPEMADGVFLMVYLPPPYEQTLTRLARAASTSSSNDLDLLAAPGQETVSGSRLGRQMSLRVTGSGTMSALGLGRQMSLRMNGSGRD
ncbi:uncharacterized protein smim28 [Aplochiton taeniatus]